MEKKNLDLKWSAQLHDLMDYEYVSHLQERIIILNEDINDAQVEKTIIQIFKWNREDEGKQVEDRKKISILCNTPGGDLYLGMVICDVIQKSLTPVHLTILGMAASMGSLIAIAAHKTLAYKHSNVLIHDGSTFLVGSSNKVKDHMKFQELKDKQVKDFIINNTKIDEKLYDEMSDREWWLTAEMALELGIVDEII
jgi:ATP-dependent Clp protease protease subunit